MADNAIASAYVQIIPTTEGIKGRLDEQLGGEANKAGDRAGEHAGASFVKKMVAVVAAAKIGEKVIGFVKDAVNAGGDLEQAIGGISTLFGDQAGYMVANAKKAWQTVGVSANDYMENVTSFSASLLQSLGGDTKKAAEIANMAMVDMGDNANKFGTDMQSIQNAYQGFAKQNYTMLDNLKLGYGGTKEEMARLLADAEKFSGVKYDMSNLSDVYEAIHVIQEELDVAGTTAKEASTTLSGSFSAMKASWENLKGAMATGSGIGQAIEDLVQTIPTYLSNLIPMIGNVLSSLPDVLSSVFESLVGNIDINVISEAIIAKIQQLPDLIGKFAEWLQAKAEGDGESQFGNAVGAIIVALGKAFIASLPAIVSALDAGFQILVEMIGGMLANMLSAFDSWINTSVLPKGREIVESIKAGIVQKWDEIKQAARDLIERIKEGITARLANMKLAGRNILNSIKDGIRGVISSLASIGMDIVRGIWSGISGGLGWIKNMIRGWIGNVKDFLKSLFGINSPSKWAADVIGAMIPAGIAVGIEDNGGVIRSAMGDLRDEMSGGLGAELSASVRASGQVLGNAARNTDPANRSYSFEIPISIDGREVARATAIFTQDELNRLSRNNNRKLGVVL